jgi:hypothetical protein
MAAQSYLSALRSHHVDLRLSITVFDDETLKRIIRGAKRQYGTSSIRHRKEITKDILVSILAHLRNTHDDNIRAAFCTAFAAFLPLGEFTWDTWTSQSLIQLSRDPFNLHRMAMYYFIFLPPKPINYVKELSFPSRLLTTPLALSLP